MPATPASSNPYRAFIILVTLILVTTALYWAQKVMVPVALAVLLAFILNPLVGVLQRRGLGRVPAVIVVALLAFVLLGAIFTGLTMQLRSLVDRLPDHEGNIRRKIDAIGGMGQDSFLDKAQHTFQSAMQDYLKDHNSAGGEVEHPQPVRVVTSPVSEFAATASPIVEALATAALVVVLVLFMLIQREDLRNRLVRLISHGRLVHTTRALDEAAQRISRYLMMQVMINATFGLALGIGLFLLRVDYALLWGFLAAALRFIPYVGSWLAMALLTLFSVAFFDGWLQPVGAVILFVTLETITAQVVEPLMFGHSTGMSAVALLIAAAFWTWLWGPIGLVLSTPLTVCLVVLGKYVPQLGFLEVLLGDQPALGLEVSYYQRLLAHDQDEASDLVEEFLEKNPLEAVYDEFLLPTLLQAKRDRDRGELTQDDEEFILQTTRDILDDLVFRQKQIQMVAAHGADALDQDQVRVLLLGCPAHDHMDELALHMLQMLLDPASSQMEVVPAGTLSAEVLKQVEREHPAVVFVAALPPGGLAQARYLCKRLRSQFPELKIAVGRWGQKENLERVENRLLADGADFVATTLLASRDQVAPLVKVARVQSPQQKQQASPEPAAVKSQGREPLVAAGRDHSKPGSGDGR